MKKLSASLYASFKLKFLLVAFLTFAVTTSFSQTTDFVISVKTDNPGTSGTTQFTIPTNPSYSYNYDVDWGDGTTSAALTTSTTHTYAAAGTYTIRISGTFASIYFNGGGDCRKLLTVSQWGTAMNWQSFTSSFNGCNNLDVTATDVPILT